MSDKMGAWVVLLAYISVALAVIGIIATHLFRCTHHWDLVDKTEFPSVVEEFKKHGLEINAHFFFSSDLRRMGMKTVAIVLRCNRCGRSRIDKISSDTD